MRGRGPVRATQRAESPALISSRRPSPSPLRRSSNCSRVSEEPRRGSMDARWAFDGNRTFRVAEEAGLYSEGYADVAQLARASACHAEGRGFESHHPLQGTRWK